ncbi:PAS domain-containing protein, partial [Shimia sp.]|uniref:PAS domain-containing protein n=1 Tax=Shimia sp. TaxID=1954381 RepID=UPI003564D9D4
MNELGLRREALHLSSRIHPSEGKGLTIDALYSVLGQAGIGLFKIDLKTGESWVSDVWKTMLGLDADAPILGQQEFLNRVHPEDLKIVEAADTALISGQESKSKSVFRIRHEDGHWLWIQSDTGVSARDAEGRPAEISGAHIDVTAEKVAEEKSRANSFRYKVL